MAERGQPEPGREVISPDRNHHPDDSILRSAAPTGGDDEMETIRGDEPRKKGAAHRGFAAMSAEKQKRIASEGGRAAHRQGVAHEWSRDEAKQAGRKGGQIVSRNREHMSEIGRKGGQSSGQRRQKEE